MHQQVLGPFKNHNLSDARSLELRFNFSGQSPNHDWQKNHINSIFVADYTGQVAIDLNPDITSQQATLSDTINFVANELLEQAMLCREAGSDKEIRIIIRISDTNIRLYVRNRVNPDLIDKLTAKLATILSEDPAIGYMRHLQNGLDSPSDDLRYLSMIVDHQVDIAWKIEYGDNTAKDAWVTTMTQVPILNSTH